jgi:hypothetical protein
MKTDLGLEAVRAARHEISHEFGNDPARLIAYYIEMQSKHEGSAIIRGPVDPPSEVEPGVTGTGRSGERHTDRP